MKLNGLKKLKRETPKPHRKACDHHWLFEHAIYSLDDGVGLAIHRQCSKCKRHEVYKIPNPKWTQNVRGFDLPNL